MDRQLRVTDDVCEQHMRDLELNFLFNLSSHMDSHGNTLATILSSNLPIVEREGRLQEIAAVPPGILPISIQSVYSSGIYFGSRSSTDRTRVSLVQNAIFAGLR